MIQIFPRFIGYSLLGTLMGLCSWISTGDARPTLRIPKHVFVKHHEVKLGEIAQIRGFSKKMTQQLKRITLGPAPMGGTRQQFPKAFLKGRLISDCRQRKIKLPEQILFKLPKVLTIERRAKVIKASKLNQLIAQEIRNYDPSQGQDLADLKIPKQANLTVPEGAHLKIKVIGIQNHSSKHSSTYSSQGGRVAVDLILKDGPRLLRNQRIFARIDLFQKAYALSREMQSGEIIQQSDLVLMRIPQSKLGKDFIRNPLDAVGCKLKRKIKANLALRNAWLWSPPLVKRGERVQMTFRRGGIFLSAEGEALGNGRRGDMIKVRNSRSKKILSGRVIGRNQVEMEF